MTQTPYFLVKSIQKAFGILEILCKEGEMGVSKLGERVNLKKSNVHRLLATLEYLGYVGKDAVTLKYSPTLKTFQIGNAIMNRIGGLHTIAHPFLEQLGKQFCETINLAVLDRREVVYIDKIESSETLKMDIKVGSRVPVYCTALGKILLAYLTDSEFKEYVKFQKLLPKTKRTVTSPQELKKILKQVLVQGYAIDDQEFSEGICCIAAPIRNHTGEVIAAVSVSGPSIRMNHDKLAQLRDPILRSAQEISKKLGYVNCG